MTGKQYKAALERLCLTQGEAARLWGVSARTGRHYAEHGVSGPVERLVWLCLATVVTLDELERLAAGK